MAPKLAREQLQGILTANHPLGPPDTEALLTLPSETFIQLYDTYNEVHRDVGRENPTFVIGRKGSGKTAFLTGVSLLAGAHTVTIESAAIYGATERLQRRYNEVVKSSMYVDDMAAAWEVLLDHAAMLGVCTSQTLPESGARSVIWTYLSSFGDPATLLTRDLLPSVAAALMEQVVTPQLSVSFETGCAGLDLGKGSLADARGALREVLFAEQPHRAVYVVVDNLEEMHRKLDTLAESISGLFRVVTRDRGRAAMAKRPYGLRIAFPAELMSKIRRISTNPDKDITSESLTIRWSASELIVLAGNRIRWFLDTHYPGAAARLALPSDHNPRSPEAAERTLRALLPARVEDGSIPDGEDGLAYVLRHTQLLPRQLIMFLNAILHTAGTDVQALDPPLLESKHVVSAVRDMAPNIVSGILSSYGEEGSSFPQALEIFLSESVVQATVSDLHRRYNTKGLERISGAPFAEFLQECMATGVYGFSQGTTERYLRGNFAYTFAGDLGIPENDDELCVHPLFAAQFFRDGRRTSTQDGFLPVYPYGADPTHEGQRF